MINQYAALPYRVAGKGSLEILLITSRDTRRWVIPKGNPIPSMAHYETAAREAFEEAGIEGGIATESIGSFRYMKRRRSGAEVPALDTVYPMLFSRLARDGPAGADAMEKMVCGQEAIPASCQAIETHENAADDVTRDVLVAVRRSFITPFDRSAITALTSAMDNAIDEMWQTAKAITLYEVTSFQPQMAEMSRHASAAAKLVLEAVPLLRNIGRHGARLHEITEAVVHLEGKADGLHDAGLRALIKAGAWDDPMHFIVNREVYRHLERVLDAFEDVADEITGIVIDHA